MFYLKEFEYLTCSPYNGEIQVPTKRGSTIEIPKDGIYEISTSFIFQSIGGKRIWGNLMRKHKDSKSRKTKGNVGKHFLI